MEYAAESKNAELAEELLLWFLDRKNYTCFSAALFQCYDLLHPDVVMELSWRHGIMQFSMPYFIQVMREYTQKVDELKQLVETKLEESVQDQKQNSLVYAPETLMLTAPPGMPGSTPAGGYGPGPGVPGVYPGYPGYGM